MSKAKKMHWAKAWLEHWLDEASVELDMCAVALRQLLQQWGGACVDADGTGWPATDAGVPFTVGRMAAMVKGTQEQVRHSLGLLKTAGIVVERDGAWGVLNWLSTQETPDAARLRQARADASSTRRRKSPIQPERVGDASAQEEQRSRGTEFSPPPSAGERKESPSAAVIAPAHRQNPSAPPATLGQRLALARELVGTFTVATAAANARIGRARYMQLEADEALPTPDELTQISRTLGDPAIASWSLPDRDVALVEAVVRQHRGLAVELGAQPESYRAEPLVVTAQDVATVYAAEPTDNAAGLSLAAGWARVLTRGAESLRRDIARGKSGQRQWFTLQHLSRNPRRSTLLDTFDLDRRDDLTPAARGSPARRRGPAPLTHPDQLTDGEIPT